MAYTIGQVAKKLGVTAHTLRYYDKEGLLPMVRKNSSGLRIFKDTDLEWLLVVECLKACGMPLKAIKAYLDMCQKGDETIAERLNMFKEQRENLKSQMRELESYMQKIEYKIAYYTEAAKTGSVESLKHNACLMREKARIFGNANDND